MKDGLTPELYGHQSSPAPTGFAAQDSDEGNPAPSYKIDTTTIATPGDTAGVSAKFSQAQNLSAYNKLSFDVKANPTDTAMEYIQIMAGGYDITLYGYDADGVTTPDDIVLGTDWTTITLVLGAISI